jgi:hypothetical protein
LVNFSKINFDDKKKIKNGIFAILEKDENQKIQILKSETLFYVLILKKCMHTVWRHDSQHKDIQHKDTHHKGLTCDTHK